MSQINVPRDLRFILLFVTNENNSCHSSVTDLFFSLGKVLQKGKLIDFTVSMGESLWLICILVLLCLSNSCLSLMKLLAGKDLSLAMIANFNQLSD